MTADLYLSRAFVEFGPFTAEEVLQFQTRGILTPMDHIRKLPAPDWTPIETWLQSHTPASPAIPATAPATTGASSKKASPKPAPAKKAAAAKKAPAKKAAAKKAPAKKA